jgi:hypothetical protein
MVKRKPGKVKANEPSMVQKQVQSIIRKSIEGKDNGKSNI